MARPRIPNQSGRLATNWTISGESSGSSEYPAVAKIAAPMITAAMYTTTYPIRASGMPQVGRRGASDPSDGMGMAMAERA